MSRESVAIGIAGVFFGLLIGWMIGSQQVRFGAEPSAAGQPQAAAAPQTPGSSQPAARLDEARVASLRERAEQNRGDAAVRVELGDAHFDAERFADAARWYEESLAIDPKNANASTDLGIAYYYMNQPDRAIAQFDRSLALDPEHTKTLLNLGIVRAFGKQDLEGAAKAWQRVVEIAPESSEARMARQALQGLRSAHPEAAPDAASGTPAGR